MLEARQLGRADVEKEDVALPRRMPNPDQRERRTAMTGRLSRVSWNLSGGPPPETYRVVGVG